MNFETGVKESLELADEPVEEDKQRSGNLLCQS
jgi:hypothetical protein